MMHLYFLQRCCAIISYQCTVGIEDACHVAANLLKLYLRELPESILTNALKGDFEAGVLAWHGMAWYCISGQQ